MKECCDNKCNQGRDCPAQVAPVKCSYPRDDEMLMIAKCALVLVLLLVFGFIGILSFVVN